MSRIVFHMVCRFLTNKPKFYTTRKTALLLLLLLIVISTPLISFTSAQDPEKAVGRRNARPLPTSKKSSQLLNPRQCPTCPEPSLQTIYAPTIGMAEATGSQIVLNNRSPNVMDVMPTFYTEEGNAVVGNMIQLQPTEIRFVDIKKLIPAQYRGRRSWGGMSLSYTGNVMEAWAQITLIDVGGAGSTDVTFSVLEGRGSDVQEAVWWMPERGTATLALGNSSATPLRTNVQFSDSEAQDVDIAPFATKYIRRRANRGDAKSLLEGTTDSVKLTTIGPAGSLRAVGVVTSDSRKFTSSIRFYEPQGAAQPHLFATNLRLKNTLPRMVLKNTSDADITAQPRFRPTEGEAGSMVELPLQTLKPHEVVEVDLSPLVGIAAGRTDLNSVSVQVTNTGNPGSLIGSLNSLQTDTNTTYDVPLRDSGRTRNLGGSYPWRVDKDYTTVVSITNVGDQPANFHVDVRYPGGSYYLAARELAIGETATFDLREIQAAQKPDHKGNKFLKSVTSGQFHWSVAPTPCNPKLVGRAEVVSRSEKVSSSYSCGVCCADSGPYGGWTDTGSMYSSEFTIRDSDGQYFDCYSYVTFAGSIQMYAQWTGDTSIATNESGPGFDTTVHGLSAGTTFLMGEWNYQYYENDGNDCYSRFDNTWDDTPVPVVTLRIRLLNSPVPNGESGDTSGAAIARQSFQMLADAVDQNGQITTSPSTSVQFTPSRTLDSTETGFPSSFNVSNGSYQQTVLLNRVNGTDRGTTFRFQPSGGGQIDFEIYTYFEVVGSREGLVGGTTACGNTITTNARFVALPSTGMCNTAVTLRRGVNIADTTVRDVGPWYPHASAATGNPCVGGNDPYWNTGGAPRVLSTNCDSNNAAIDIGDGTFADLGMTGTGTVLWRFN